MARSSFFSTTFADTPQSTYILSVSQLNEYVESLFSCDKLLRNISVEGEISGFKRYSSGHCYFALKDKNASIRCVMFKGYASYLGFEPLDGMRVIISGYVSLYVKDGQYQCYVENMRSVGEGELYKRFLLLKAQLEEEGLFAQEHKKDLPFLPKTVGVITSRSGAVWHDIQSVTKRRFPSMNLLLCHCSVQGEQAPAEIVQAIKVLDNSKAADVIIIGRGGGSIEDLWCFNDETVARAIYACKTPIISAVGHETDFTIADFVADMRAPTPSAAAELAVPLYSDIMLNLDDVPMAIGEKLLSEIKVQRQRLDLIENRVKAPSLYLESKFERLNHIVQTININMSNAITASNLRFENCLERLRVLSPINVLGRGYSIVKTNNDEFITSAAMLKKYACAKVVFFDGEVQVCVSDDANIKNNEG